MNQLPALLFLMRTLIARSFYYAALWWAVTENSTKAWPIGVIFASLAVLASMRMQGVQSRNFSLVGALIFALYFVFHSVKGGMQVALIALRPQMNLDPDILEIPLRLQDEQARIVLATAMTLMPGTLSADLRGSTLLLHVLDRKLPASREVRCLESHVARMLRSELI